MENEWGAFGDNPIHVSAVKTPSNSEFSGNLPPEKIQNDSWKKGSSQNLQC